MTSTTTGTPHLPALMAALGLLCVVGCNNDTVLPSGNEIAEKNGAVCEPKPASELEDCNVWGETLIQIDTKEKLRKVCESECRNIPWLSVFEIPGVTTLDAFRNRRILDEISVRRMPDLRTTRGLDVQDGARISVHTNPRLKELTGLRDVREAGKLWISNNDLDDLEAVAQIEEMIYTYQMAFLIITETDHKDLSALDGLNVTGDSVDVGDNEKLTTFPKLVGTPDQVFIRSNEQLRDISNLKSFDAVLNFLVIQDNPNLKRCRIEEVLDEIRFDSDTTIKISGNSNLPCN